MLKGVKKMNGNWIKVIIGACFEVVWVTGLKHAHDLFTWAVTILAIIISFYLMLAANRRLPVGTVYAVFVGLGTVGTVLSEIVFFNEPFSFIKMVLILILLVGVIGLKIFSKEVVKEGEK